MLKRSCTLLVSLSLSLPSWSANPPSMQTKEELFWTKLSEAARVDLTSKVTTDLMAQFQKEYRNSAKAPQVRYMLGETQFKLGNYDKASVIFEKFSTDNIKDPMADSALYRLGECYYNLKAYNSALAVWERLPKEFKSSALVPDSMEKVAMIRMRMQEWGKADEQFNKLEQAYPDFGRELKIKENHGLVLFHLKDFDEAAKLLEGVNTDKGSYYRGLALFELKLYENAVAMLKDLVSDKVGPYTESAFYLKAEGFFQKGDYNLASSEFQAFIKQFPTSPLSVYAQLRVAASHLLVKDTAKAMAVADQALKGKVPLNVQIYGQFIIACALMDDKKFIAAATLFGVVANKSDIPQLSSVSLVRKAWCEKNSNQPLEFEKDLTRVEEKFSSTDQMPLVRFLQGAQLYEKGNWEEAGARFEMGVLRYPYSVLSEAGLALMVISYSKAKRLDQLVTAANAALKLLENNYSSASVYWRSQSYYFVGKAYYDMARYKDAIPLLEKITTKFSGHVLAPQAQLLLAWCYLETKQTTKAREKAISLIGNQKVSKEISVNASYLVAASYFNAKEYNQAISHLADFLKDNPNDSLAPQASYLIGLSYHQKKVFGSAIEEWTKCINNYPNHPLAQDAYLHIGDLYFKAGDYANAAKFYKNFREKWPSSKYIQLALYQEMQSYFNGKDDESAVKTYPLYFEKYPQTDNLDDAKHQLEVVYFRRGEHGDPDKLLEFISKYPKSPYAPQARYKRGQMALEQKQWNMAVQEMEQFLRDYPSDALFLDAQYALGVAYENSNQPEKATVQYRHLINTFPTKPNAVDAAFRLGTMFFNQQKYKEAVEVFEFAASKKVSEELKSNLYYNMALSYENLGQPEKAAASYDMYSKYSKDKDQIRESLMSAGLLLKKAEKWTQAIPFFERVVKDAGSPEMELQALNFLGDCYRQTGKEAQAIATYEKLIGMEPASSDVRLAGLAQLAYLYEQKQNTAQALRVYEKISISEGKAEWVKAAKDRVEALSASQKIVP